MAEGYQRQSIFIDGDVILAEHANQEFDRLVNVMKETTGHNHDGTVAGGAPVPLLKDPTGVQDLTLTELGATGSVITNDIYLREESPTKLVTEYAAKGYADTLNLNLSNQFDAFTAIPGNHTHANVTQLANYGTISEQVASFTANSWQHYRVLATTGAVDVSLTTLVAGSQYTITNSRLSTDLVQVLNPASTIQGVSLVPLGTDIILNPGDTLSLVATSTTTLEVL